MKLLQLEWLKVVQRFAVRPKNLENLLTLLVVNRSTGLILWGLVVCFFFKPKSFDRDLLMWLMEKLNPETMRLEIAGGKEIEVNEHAVECVLGLPSKGGDPPIVKDKEGHIARELVARAVFGIDSVKVAAKDLKNMVTSTECDDNFAIRAFIIVAFNLLLFINTDSYIRVVDAKWTENLDVIDGINWCKALIDNLRFSARLWRNERDKKEHANIKKIAINSCGIFLNLKSISETCYQKLPPTQACPASYIPAAAPDTAENPAAAPTDYMHGQGSSHWQHATMYTYAGWRSSAGYAQRL
ncbi:uncharacterized protein C2845_PM18G07080 [Panicum miliaceum]|uniref:Uncharacterized protein n=1 Tax=Panicum miliaceum TaxID=4540 RepID=A0A3L6PKH2_PANMI|nr:uncharacterized protein C2845_PM18G07080 [Panicum miliaceum]